MTDTIEYWGLKSDDLGESIFVNMPNYSVRAAVGEVPDLFLQFRGRACMPEDVCELAGAEKLFIMLGLNDVALIGTDETIARWSTLIDNLHGRCPDMLIVIQSCTPICYGRQYAKYNNRIIDDYNERLKALAFEKGCSYVDISSALKDENGNLKYNYSSDAYVHLMPKVGEIWADSLRDPSNYYNYPPLDPGTEKEEL